MVDYWLLVPHHLSAFIADEVLGFFGRNGSGGYVSLQLWMMITVKGESVW